MHKKIKILLVLPLYGGSLPIGYYCAEALKELGHQVGIFDAPPFLEAYRTLRSLNISQERFSALEQNFTQLLSQAIYAQAETLKPDLILAMAQAPLNRNILRKFKQENIKTAMWFVEDYKIFPYWQALAPLYDYFFIIQKEPFLSKLKEIDVPNAYYLPMAASPSFHTKEKLSLEEEKNYGADLGFMGAGYPNRRMAFRALIKYDFKIWGSDWENDDLLQKYVQKQGQRISPEESIKIYNANKINLNLHSSTQIKELVPDGDFVNPRTFELASMEAFQLVDKRALMDELFICTDLNNPIEDAELATFDSMESLHENIAYYLKYPEKRAKIAANARKRIEKEHSYTHRMQTLIQCISDNSPDWPTLKEEISWPEALTPEIKTKIQNVTAKLNLDADASFDTVVQALKRNTGELDETETAILFLAEWNKFYLPK